MFRKREDIEKDFIAYGALESDPKPKGSLLGTMIQLLSVIVLLGVVTLMGMFGYKYWQKEFGQSEQTPQAPVATADTTQVPLDTAGGVSDAPKQKLYTQEEMQAIISMLMEQMQSTQAAKKAAPVAEVTETKETEETQPAETEIAEEDTAALAAALENAEIDTIDTAEQNTLAKTASAEVYTKTEAKEKPKTDTYNKVVVKPSKNSYDDLASLSKKISGIVDTMQAKKSGSSYTKSIKKEVLVRSGEMRVIIVQRGDTLGKIAQRAYGSAMAYDYILAANPDLIKNPDHIYVGQRLRVPVLKKRKEQ